MEYTFKKLSIEDCDAVLEIMNYFIENSYAAYNQNRIGPEVYERFYNMARGYPALTVRDESDKIIGFGFLHPYHPADTFIHTAEITYFIMPEHTHSGLGTRLLDHFTSEARKKGITTILASISSLNDQSLKFHRKHGFIECGRFKQIGLKNGTEFDMVWMQKFI